MKTFTQFIMEEYETTKITSAGGKELHDHLGEKHNSIFKALIKHPVFRDKHVRLYPSEPNHYTHTEYTKNHHRITVHTHPYLTHFEISRQSRGPAKVSAYHHMIADKDDPKRFHTLKIHGYDV